MFKTTLRADERTDIAKVVAELKQKVERNGVSASDAMLISTSITTTLNDLVVRGREMASSGSTLAAEKTLKGGTYEVRLVFKANGRRSMFQRLSGLLWGG